MSPSRSGWGRCSAQMLAFGAGLALLAAWCWWSWPRWQAATPSQWLLLPLPAVLYLAAHALRGLRLFLLLYDGRIRLMQVLAVHLHAAGIGRLIPFKLGELYRIGALCSLTGHVPHAIMTVWMERAADALLVLLILIALLAGSGADLASASSLLIALTLFLFVTFFLFLVLPEMAVLATRYLITRHNSARSLSLLRIIDRGRALVALSAGIFRARWASLAWLSLGIWLFELGALVAAVALYAGQVRASELYGLFQASTAQEAVWQATAPATAAAAGYLLASLDTLVVLVLAGGLISVMRAGWRWRARRIQA